MSNVNQFNPTNRITSGDDEPDLLASAVLNSLTRPIYAKLSWSVLGSFILTWVTVGLLPMIMMIQWLRGFIATQQQQLWHLAEWMRVQSGDRDAVELQNASQRIRFSMPLAMLTGAFVFVAIVAIVGQFSHQRFTFARLYAFAIDKPDTTRQMVFTVAMSAAAVCHWAHLAWHQQNVEHYLRWFNQLLVRQSKDEIPPQKLELGFAPAWIAAGLVLALGRGAVWAVPVMLAAGAHRRYIIEGSVRMRSLLAERLRAMLLERRPRMRVPGPIQVVRTCVRPNCRAPLPSAASWCPRCGTKAIRTMDVVA